MNCTTKVHYTDGDGNIRIKENNTFTSRTSLLDIIQWIFTWLKYTYAFDLQILNPHSSEWIDFDHHYFNQTKPYEHQSRIDLKILPTNDGQFRNSTFIVEKYQAPSLITIDRDYPTIIFTENVNAEQRDEDIDKRSFIKGNSRLNVRRPKVKIMSENINVENCSLINLLVFLIWEVCDKGVRTLYYHPYRKLVGDCANEDHITIVPTSDMFEHGDDLNVPTMGIRGAKTGDRDKSKFLLCQLSNRLCEETSYETSRLACLLMGNGNPWWNTLALSNAMIFTKSFYTIESRDALDCNGQIIERILVQIFKRKTNLNQHDAVPEHTPHAEKRRTSTESNASTDSFMCAVQNSFHTTEHMNSRYLPITVSNVIHDQSVGDPSQVSESTLLSGVDSYTTSPNWPDFELTSSFPISPFGTENNADQSDTVNSTSMSPLASYVPFYDITCPSFDHNARNVR
ncbi:unnamed protein product [Adineta ricciae]|uniref:Uncharacterized protein n=1 Tax=Adineta ricciae TaxID=249248 RepID=A0A815Q1Z1_ADIRI|nr:unnamed protein product [Adineta ricciae]CAF1456254.1 unnamed protein product [Adineta ricciae]